MYAFVLFNQTDMTLENSMGKTLTNYAWNDSGVLNDSESCDTPKSLKTSKVYNKKALDIDTTSSTKNIIYVEHTVQSPGSLSTSLIVENQSLALTRIAEEKDEIDFNVMILRDEKLHVDNMEKRCS